MYTLGVISYTGMRCGGNVLCSGEFVEFDAKPRRNNYQGVLKEMKVEIKETLLQPPGGMAALARLHTASVPFLNKFPPYRYATQTLKCLALHGAQARFCWHACLFLN